LVFLADSAVKVVPLDTVVALLFVFGAAGVEFFFCTVDTAVVAATK
jgi:hypothetical protein